MNMLDILFKLFLLKKAISVLSLLATLVMVIVIILIKHHQEKKILK